MSIRLIRKLETEEKAVIIKRNGKEVYSDFEGKV